MSPLVFLIVVLAVALVLFGFISGGRKPRRKRGGGRTSHNRAPVQTMPRDQIFARWQTIEAMAASGGGNGLRQAINEADKLLDHVMRQQGASGDSMADRMRSFNNRWSHRDDIWRAHKIRNALAHEIGYDLVPSQAKEALGDFKVALTDLGAL